MFSSDRNQYRQVFITAWQKANGGQPLTPLEAQLVALLRQHPEYHNFLKKTARALVQDFLPEQGEINPFLHLGLHLAIREQVHIDQPIGVRSIYQKLVRKLCDEHKAEHQMMDCLAEALWQAQYRNVQFNEADYLSCLKRHTSENGGIEK